MANMHSLNVRQAFNNQRAQCIIVDLADMPPLFLNNFTKAIQNVITLACSIRGGIRVPAFGLAVLKKSITFVYELDVTRGNFHKIIAALNSLTSQYEFNLIVDVKDYTKGLQNALDKFIKVYDFKTEKNEWNVAVKDIEVTVISVKDCQLVRSYFEEILANIDISRVEKLTVIELTSNDITPSLNHTAGFLETFITHGTHFRCLENYFKHWIIEHGNDVDVVLHFSGPDKSTFSLKCNIYECMMNPLALPFGSRVFIQQDSLSVQMTGMSVAKSVPSTVPVYELNIVGRVKIDEICESSVFGAPVCLRPTTSWKINAEEERLNEEHFAEVTNQMCDQDVLLLAQMRSHFQTDQFTPYFILTAGNNCLLMKSFASGDWSLPWLRNILVRPAVAEETFARVSAVLNSVPLMNDLDPNALDSGLLKALSVNLKQTKRDPTLDVFDDFAPSSSFKRGRRSK